MTKKEFSLSLMKKKIRSRWERYLGSASQRKLIEDHANILIKKQIIPKGKKKALVKKMLHQDSRFSSGGKGPGGDEEKDIEETALRLQEEVGKAGLLQGWDCEEASQYHVCAHGRGRTARGKNRKGM